MSIFSAVTGITQKLSGAAVGDLAPSASGSIQNNISKGTPSTGAAAGNRTYYRGLPLMLRTNRAATQINKANRTIQAMPRQKFLFYATFTPGPALQNANFSGWKDGFAFQIAKVDRPKASPQLKLLNQYNRKRIVHTGIEYPDINITLHDTVDDRVLKIWRDYHKWYFGEGRTKKSANTWKTSVIQPRESMNMSTGWGFSPNAGVTWDTNFFDTLDIYTFYGKKYTQVTFYNPKIETITFDGLDYASTDLASVDMSIKHEGFAYTQVAAPVTAKQVELFGLSLGDYYEPADAFGGVNSFLLDLNDNIEQSVDSLLGGVSNIPFVGGVLAGLGSNAIRASGVGGFPTRIAQGLSSSSLNRWGRFL